MIKVKFNDTIQYFTVTFSRSNNIITLTGSDLPEITTGFKTYKLDCKQLGDFSDFKTIYRKLDNAIQFSNDSSVWVEPTRDVTVQAIWNDGNNGDNLRPEEVAITVNSKKVVLKAEDDWKKVYPAVKESENIVISKAVDVEGYEISINGTNVVYSHEYIPPVDPTPTIEERVADLESATIELYDLIEGGTK